ncbi:FAD-binding domain-containing protein [Gonapodya prolifera JEL478]|uniref:FAD-binding domain-containing protein n=1 Tax=Gonapodya prolifera (strain JEL478) TaxID=1344416 RepID=A0A138ZYB5_GONPJ|nr:FAD-binding domain-containing protein [Gonapodya prolifera JEL478]|eukprot:KXS09487.1 FAD-binding domain-containing protein [Gonapodya prolifera JEL478]
MSLSSQASVKSPPSVLDRIRKRIRGRIVLPSDSDFTFLLADGTFNRAQTARPSALLQPLGTKDVSEIIRICNETNTEFTVSGGRHTLRCFKDNVLCIDLRLMRSVVIEAERRVAHVQGGCKLMDLDGETSVHGLCTPAGTDPRTGVGGFLLGGGWGWLARQYGMAVDNVLEVELVLADGTVVVANDDPKNKFRDLFWAVRGAGMSFGVATRFTVKLYPIPVCRAGFRLYPIERARECMVAVREHMTKAPVTSSTMAELNWGPPNPETGVRRAFAQVLPIYLGSSQEDGKRVLKDVIEAVPKPFVDQVGEMPYMRLQAMLMEHIPPSYRAEQAVFVEDLSDELIDVLLEQFSRSPAEGTFIAIFGIGGKIGEKSPTDTAFPWRLKRGHWVTILASATNPEHLAKLQPWVAETGSRVMRFAQGQFANRIGHGSKVGEDQTSDFFGVNAERLKALKAVYDPKGRFSNSDAGVLTAVAQASL